MHQPGLHRTGRAGCGGASISSPSMLTTAATSRGWVAATSIAMPAPLEKPAITTRRGSATPDAVSCPDDGDGEGVVVRAEGAEPAVVERRAAALRQHEHLAGRAGGRHQAVGRGEGPGALAQPVEGHHQRRRGMPAGGTRSGSAARRRPRARWTRWCRPAAAARGRRRPTPAGSPGRPGCPAAGPGASAPWARPGEPSGSRRSRRPRRGPPYHRGRRRRPGRSLPGAATRSSPRPRRGRRAAPARRAAPRGRGERAGGGPGTRPRVCTTTGVSGHHRCPRRGVHHPGVPRLPESAQAVSSGLLPAASRVVLDGVPEEETR